jgi:hypothetical protein
MTLRSSYRIVRALWREDLIMMRIGMALIAASLVAAAIPVGSARAGATPPDTEGGRYVFTKQGDGLLRLDTRSGAVALCSEQPVGWACQAAPEDRALFENEIARLQNENAALKRVLVAHGLALPSGVAPDAPVAQSEPALRLPSDADIDRVIALVGRVWQRFVDAVARAQKQIFNKS